MKRLWNVKCLSFHLCWHTDFFFSLQESDILNEELPFFLVVFFTYFTSMKTKLRESKEMPVSPTE